MVAIIAPIMRWLFFTIWTGQAFSLLGSSLVQFALVWWLTSTTGSATVLATATLAAVLPQVPTVAEAGVQGYDVAVWSAIVAPAGLPPAIVDKIRVDVNKALSGPEAEKLFATQTLERIRLEPSQYADFMREDFERHGQQIKAANVTKE